MSAPTERNLRGVTCSRRRKNHEHASSPAGKANRDLPANGSHPGSYSEYLDPDFRLAIQSLQVEELHAGLSKYLSEEQMGALQARRDRILDRCE